MKTFVLVTTDVLSVIYSKTHPSGSATDSLTVAQAVQHALAQGTNRANSRNDWSDWFTEAFHPAMSTAGFRLAQDIEAGHTWLIDIHNRQVATAYSFCAQDTDPNNAHVLDLGHSGKLNEFLLAWKQALDDTSGKTPVPDLFVAYVKGASEPAPAALPAPAKPAAKAVPTPATKAAEANKAAAARTAKRNEEAAAKLATKSKTTPGKKSGKAAEPATAEPAPVDRAAVVTRPPSDALAKAKAMLRSSLKPAVAAAR